MNKLLQSSLLLALLLCNACKTPRQMKSEKDYVLESETNFVKNKLYNLFTHNQSLASEYVRRGVMVTYEKPNKSMELDKLFFHLTHSSYYDLENKKIVKSATSIAKPFFIKIYEIDQAKNISTKMIYKENIEVKADFQTHIASVDLSQIAIELPKNGFFIEFCSNLEKEIIKFEYSNYPSISKEKVTNFKNFQPMLMKLYKKEEAVWEKDDFLMSRNENYKIKLVFH